MTLDVRTVFVSAMVLTGLSVLVTWSLWRQNRSRSPEIGLWLANAVLQLLALMLLALRGVVSDFLSIIVANAFVIGGTMLLLIGLERYVGSRGRQWHNAVGLTVYLLVHAYFTFVSPDLAARNINSAVALIFVASQGAWLMLRRVPKHLRDAARDPGLVFLAVVVLAIGRFPLELLSPQTSDLLSGGLGESLYLIFSNMLFVALTFALLLMGNRRLIGDLEADILERDHAREALRASEEKFATAFRTSPDAVIINRLADGRYIDINEGFTELTGYTADDVRGKTSADTTIWADPADRQRLVDRLRADGVVHNLEAEFRRKDGTTTTGLMSAQTIVVDGEHCILSVTRDISDRKRIEDEIVRLNQELEARVDERTEELTATNEELLDTNARLDEATRAKSDFLASMSHELRTPLNSIIGFSDLLGRGMVGELEPEQEKQIRMINASGKYLLELVNEVLDLSAIEVGRMRIDMRQLQVREVLAGVVESLQPLAQHRGLELMCTVAPDVEAFESDRTKVEQILFNLIGNAIKFTDVGTASVHVSRDGTELAFAVSDTGHGIAPENLERIFDEFYQAERHDVAKSEGTGLGLTVSRRLAQMLGGSISVESALGEGSTFTLRLPA